jgi:seryl-tRNA synthetase
MDYNLFRDDKDIQTLIDNQKKRFKDTDIIITIQNLVKTISQLNFENVQYNKAVNALSKTMNKKDKQNTVIDQEKLDKVSLEEALIQDFTFMETKYLSKKFGNIAAEIKKKLNIAVQERDTLLRKIGNIVHDTVPVSDNEDDNSIVRTYGEIKNQENMLSHYDLMPKLGLNTNTSTQVAGDRAYYMTGKLAELKMALEMYSVQFLTYKKYKLVIPPYFINKESMEEVAQLEQFDEELYELKDQNKYLIATSEQPIACLHKNEILDRWKLPIKYVGNSPCFRKEVGAHKRDTRGIFRVHQFDKIEQFCITEPEDSWEMMETMIKNSEEFYQSLKIPYRVVTIVSGKLNNSAAKKYDLEGWFPGSKTYRELVSCSNCTDYQSRNLNIKYEKNGERKLVHMLNSTLCAITRTLCVICETYQTDKGIKIPEVLIPYLGKDFIEFD